MAGAEAAADISIVIPNWNGRHLLGACLESLRATRGELRLEIIVVDNASTDGSVELLRTAFPEVRLLENSQNEGFARACNRGVASSAAPFVLLFNTDAILLEGALPRLLAVLRAQPRAALVGPQLHNIDGSFQSSHSPFPSLWREWMILSSIGRLLHGPSYPSPGPEEEKGAQRTDWVSGACILVRREAYAAARGLDEGYFMYAEEMDLCYRLHQAGWQIWYEPAAVVVHLGGGSARQLGGRGEAMHYRGRVRFYRLHHGPVTARLARWMIVTVTLVKIAVHAVLRAVSGGRHGRAVVSLRTLRAELRGV